MTPGGENGALLWDSEGGYRRIDETHIRLCEQVKKATAEAKLMGRKACLDPLNAVLLRLESSIYFLSVELRRMREELEKRNSIGA